MSILARIGRFFQRPLYTSDIMAFVADMKEKDPTLDARQVAGRNIQWLRKNDRATQAELDAGRVAQKAYPYQTEAQ